MGASRFSNSFANISKAVIPCAGLGTRFLPATKAIPKEMIPIIDVPMIQYIVEEIVRSGIQDVILVTARHKEAIENHFDHNYELEDTLDKKGKTELSKLSKDLAQKCNVITIHQKMPLGLGHAVLCAEPIIGKEPFAVLLGDDLVVSDKPCTRQLIEVAQAQNGSVVGVMNVPKADTPKYGIVGGKEIGEGLRLVDRLVEKPKPEAAPSTLAIPGRYVLSSTIFDCIRETKPGAGGEIQLTDALQKLAQKEKLFSFEFEGRRYDTGDRLGYIEATLAFALKRPDLSGPVRELMKKYLNA